MKLFDKVGFDYPQCMAHVEELREWLAGRVELSEQGDVLPFFRARPQLAVLFGMFNPRIGWADRIAWEFDIFGDFACDLAVGEQATGNYCFVEFEDARANSVFTQKGVKATREWGQRFDHGYSQIIDWVHRLDGRPGNDLLARFGRHEINYEAVLVIGRDRHVSEAEIQRLQWRTNKVTVNTRKVICMTFDELLAQFQARVGLLRDVADAAAAAAAAAKPGLV